MGRDQEMSFIHSHTNGESLFSLKNLIKTQYNWKINLKIEFFPLLNPC